MKSNNVGRIYMKEIIIVVVFAVAVAHDNSADSEIQKRAGDLQETSKSTSRWAGNFTFFEAHHGIPNASDESQAQKRQFIGDYGMTSYFSPSYPTYPFNGYNLDYGDVSYGGVLKAHPESTPMDYGYQYPFDSYTPTMVISRKKKRNKKGTTSGPPTTTPSSPQKGSTPGEDLQDRIYDFTPDPNGIHDKPEEATTEDISEDQFGEPLDQDPIDPPLPSEINNPTDPPLPTEIDNQTDPPLPPEIDDPTDPPLPSGIDDPIDPPLPTEIDNPTDPPLPSEIDNPIDPPLPSEIDNPTDPPLPSEIDNPTDPPLPSGIDDPTDPPLPTEIDNPTDPPLPSGIDDPTDPPLPTEIDDPTDPPLPSGIDGNDIRTDGSVPDLPPSDDSSSEPDDIDSTLDVDTAKPDIDDQTEKDADIVGDNESQDPLSPDDSASDPPAPDVSTPGSISSEGSSTSACNTTYTGVHLGKDYSVPEKVLRDFVHAYSTKKKKSDTPKQGFKKIPEKLLEEFVLLDKIADVQGSPSSDGSTPDCPSADDVSAMDEAPFVQVPGKDLADFIGACLSSSSNVPGAGLIQIPAWLIHKLVDLVSIQTVKRESPPPKFDFQNMPWRRMARVQEKVDVSGLGESEGELYSFYTGKR